MKRNGMIFGVLEIILAIFAVFCIIMMVQSRAVPEKRKIAVIVEDSENDIWTPLKNGAEEAGKEKNVEIRFVTTGTFENAADELSSVDDAVSDGCDGILINPINEKVVQGIRKRSYNIPILLIMTDSKYDVRSVSVDAADAGQKLADMIVDDNGEGRTIGIITDKRNSRITREIKKGMDEVLKSRNYKEVFLRKGANEAFISASRPDVLVCLDEDAITMTSGLVEANRLKYVRVYGCGFAPKDVYQLDMENIRGLVYPDVFRIGYSGVNEMVSRLSGNLSQPRSQKITSYALRKGDIFKDNGILSTFSRK